MGIYAFGAYGTNNVGDEAIFEGIRRSYPDVRQIFINKSDKPGALWYGDINEPGDFEPKSHLIIGGGGLLYSLDAIETMVRLGRLCQANGGTVTVEGIGCEAYRPEYEAPTRALFGLARSITVRTASSARIVRALGFECEIVPDFAFAHADLFARRAPRSGRLRVGVVLAGDAFGHRYEGMRLLIRKHTVGERTIEFVHIPHSKSFVDIHNNDEIVGRMIWSSIHIDHMDRTALFRCLDYSHDLDVVADRYAGLDAIISERFHGIVFGIMAGLPVLVNAHDRKNASILDERPDARALRYDGQDDLFAKFEELIGIATANRGL